VRYFKPFQLFSLVKNILEHAVLYGIESQKY
jgi:hypothetical protein